MERYHDWPTRLNKFIIDYRDKGFDYGKHDCCLYVCDAIKAITGVDMAEDFRGYNKKSFQKLLDDNKGVEGIALQMAKKLNLPRIPISFAQRGDVVYLKDEKDQKVLGIISMNGDIYVASEIGIVSFPINQGIHAWRIG